ncbi:MAG: beta-glucosidase [Pseudonocardiales bacterium]|jgi:beta-glucosidase|nr:beta-glucosidase [Pseudonocardiales bacterium]
MTRSGTESTIETDPAALKERLTAIARSLTLEQQVRLLTGADMWSTHAEPAAGLRAMVLSDGPSGVRGQIWDERDPSLNLPSATALSASWDPELAYRYGAIAAAEAIRKGVDVVLGPTINMHRSPLGGRHFEAYSEDPLLTGEIGVAFIQGVQSAGIAACPKHYIANDFETERFTASVQVSDQALRELYLAPFERAVRDGGTWTVMSSYNAVNGVTMSENDLLRSPLCEEWGFDGLVISDWTAVRSLAAAKARQDLAMPGPDGPWGAALVAAVQAGEVPVETIEEKVRRLLLLAVRVGALGAEPDPRPRPIIDAGFAREAEAQGIVLVRNTEDVLPLRAPASIAVSGQNAELPRTQGGGSATVVPTETSSPLSGLREAMPATVVSYSLGALVQEGITALPLDCLTDPETGSAGLRVRFRDSAGNLELDELRFSSALVWLGNAPVGDLSTMEIIADYRPTATGPIELGFAVVGPTVLSIDGTEVLGADNVAGDDPASAVLSPPASTTRVELQAGRSYRLRLEHSLADTPRMPGTLGITLGSRPAVDSADALIAEAAEAAREAEVAVVVVGTNEQVESEGFDRDSLALPGRQDDLVRAVAAANPRTVVVVNSGSPVTMPWRSEVQAVLLTWFGGQEYGRALADVLTGAVEPGGRLPTTWPADEADVPVIDVTPVDGVLRYDEGIHIGYRAWLRAGAEPAYPFGFGLGYTSFGYESLSVSPGAGGADGTAEVTLRVRNTGARTGREVAQVYLSRPDSAVDRPVRWLAGFAGVTVPAGETATVTVTLPRRTFEHWQQDGWALEPGSFTVQAGPNVADLPLNAELTL